MIKQLSRYYVLFVLVLVFITPGVAAYFFYKHPTWLGISRINEGHLLQPAVQVTSLPSKAKWRIVFWAPKHCQASCMQELDVLARVRLALGRKLYQVEQLLLLGQQATPLDNKQRAELEDKDFRVEVLAAAEQNKLDVLAKKPTIYLMNPDNYLILHYAPKQNPEHIYKDLKLLLSVAEIKKG